MTYTDLGPHTVHVLASYGIGIVLIALPVIVTLIQARNVKRQLSETESQQNG